MICKTVGIVWAVFPFCEEEKIKFSQIVGIERNQSRFFVQNTSIPKESISIKYRDDELNQEEYYSSNNKNTSDRNNNNNASSSSSSSVSMSKKVVESTNYATTNSKFEITTGLLVVNDDENNNNNADDDELQQNRHQHETTIEDDGSVVLTELLELEIVAPQESRRRALGWLKWLTDECGMQELEFVK